jgi:NADH oxidase (H2O2-forming)
MPDKPLEIVIIGLGASGLYASKSALSFNRNCRVTIIEKRDHDQFSPCGLPFAIEGVVKSFEELKYAVPEVPGKLAKHLRHEAVAVDMAQKVVTAIDLATQEEKRFPFDSLILSHGTAPIVLPTPGARELVGKGVHFCSTIENSEALLRAALASKKKRAVVIGGGAVGLEVAVALKERGLEVAVTKRTEPPLPRTLDPEMGKFIVAELERLGIRVLFGKGIDSINGTDKVESATIAGEVIDCDIVVMAVGMKADTRLAEGIGAKIEKGLVAVDNRMETSVKGVFATGDMVQSYSRIDRSPMAMQLATSAFRQGMTAGVNAAGGNTEYPGVLNTLLTGVGKLDIAATGYTLETALELGYKAKAIATKREDRPHYIPGAKEINLRIIVEEDTGRILGAQAIAEEGAGSRINVIALAIQAGMNLYDLLDAELAYFPRVSQMYDPLTQLAEVAVKRLRMEPKPCRGVFTAQPRARKE